MLSVRRLKNAATDRPTPVGCRNTHGPINILQEWLCLLKYAYCVIFHSILSLVPLVNLHKHLF